MVAAFAFQDRRNFGPGLIAPRPGPARASVAGTVLGLAFELNRGGLITRLIAFAGLGLLFGNLATSIGDIVANNPAMAQLLASGAVGSSDLAFAFLVTSWRSSPSSPQR